MSVKFITCIYGDLYGTELGGRPSRFGHYMNSLLSLLKMTDADFVCYTSTREIDRLKNFFYVENNISEQKLKFVLSNLRDTNTRTYFTEWFNHIVEKSIELDESGDDLVNKRNK